MSITQRLKRLFAKDSSPAAPAQAAPTQPATERAGGMCPDLGKEKVLHWTCIQAGRVIHVQDPSSLPPKPPAIPEAPPIPEFLRKR